MRIFKNKVELQTLAIITKTFLNFENVNEMKLIKLKHIFKK